MDLSHINAQGRAKMVDVSGKDITKRCAVAEGFLKMEPDTMERIMSGGIQKGDVLSVAQVAGVMAAKKTSDIIPMCHPLMLTGVDLQFDWQPESVLHIQATVKTTGKTGVEMEALHAVSAAALTIYDMCKAIDRGMVIQTIRLVEKEGGKSGHFKRKPDA